MTEEQIEASRALHVSLQTAMAGHDLMVVGNALAHSLAVFIGHAEAIVAGGGPVALQHLATAALGIAEDNLDQITAAMRAANGRRN